MSLRILYVAYPLLAISDESCGGAEQVLITLEREMSKQGYRTVVAAADGSRVRGELYATGKAAGALAGNGSVVQPLAEDEFARRETEHNSAILRLLAEERFDLVHDMSGSFWRCAAQVEMPVLATLHLPPVLYTNGTLDSPSLNLYFNCVSRSQARAFAHLPRMFGVVENGIDLTRFAAPDSDIFDRGSAQFLLWMGRVCEEKGPHIAIDVAADAGLPIVLAGQVYPFSYHEQYFERDIEPRLRRYPSARFICTPSFQEKLELLDSAHALLVTSRIDETSSLVAMEAMARGTPVIAFRRGALPEIVEHGVTGFVVDTPRQMAEAVNEVSSIDPAACRSRAMGRYSSTRMADDYLRLYGRVLGSSAVFRQSVA